MHQPTESLVVVTQSNNYFAQVTPLSSSSILLFCIIIHCKYLPVRILVRCSGSTEVFQCCNNVQYTDCNTTQLKWFCFQIFIQFHYGFRFGRVKNKFYGGQCTGFTCDTQQEFLVQVSIFIFMSSSKVGLKTHVSPHIKYCNMCIYLNCHFSS